MPVRYVATVKQHEAANIQLISDFVLFISLASIIFVLRLSLALIEQGILSWQSLIELVVKEKWNDSYVR